MPLAKNGSFNLLIVCGLVLAYYLTITFSNCTNPQLAGYWFFLAPLYALVAAALMIGFKSVKEGAAGFFSGLVWGVVYLLTVGAGYLLFSDAILECVTF